MARFNANQFKQKMRQAQRQAERKVRQAARRVEQQINREIDKVNRENKRQVDAYNRKVVNDYKAGVRRRNANAKKIIADLNRQLRSASSSVRYSPAEEQLADRVHMAVGHLDPREYDTFLSYARIDGGEVATQLRDALEALEIAVWFDAVAIQPGRSQALQMDAGLRKARAGIALLTPAYLTGRFWTERELAALLSKDILIPVLHNVTFDDVKEYSGILPDLAGFTTQSDSIEDIAQKIAAAVAVEA